ncbi:GerAB/ArcD/ProY family transporter [Paenibacillus eucommiae]|nr:endospore germination permease [Paenibacillus eucommiae]
MERAVVISNQQMLALVVVATIGTSSLYAPSTLAHYAGRDSWYLVVVGGAIGLLNIFVFLWLNRMYPEKNLITICLHVFGRWFGGLLALVFIFYFLDLATWVLREFSQFFIITLDPAISMTWYLIAGAIMCAYAVYYGLEVFARVAEIIFVVTTFTFLAIYMLLISQYHPEYLLPVLEHGMVKPLKGLMVSVSWFGDLMFISMIIRHVRHTKHTPYYAMAAVGVIFCILLLAVLSCTMILGGETTATFTYPSISLIQNISFFHNIERFDAALVAIWVMSSFVKITVYFWSALQGLSDLLRLRQPRRFIVPLAAAFVICSKYKAWGLIEIASFYDKQAWYFVLFQFFVPSALLLAAHVKEKYRRSR